MNTQIATLPEPDLFKKMIIISVGLHVGIIIVFGLKTALFPHEALDLDAAVKVDLVGLPDKIQQLPDVVKVPPVPQPVEKPKTVPAPPPIPVKAKPVVITPTTKAGTLAKIKKLEREEREKKVLENIKQEVAQEEAKASRQAKLNQLLKGNAISPGTALHGLAKSEFNEYLVNLQNHVQEHWNLPEWLQNDTLKATVIVYIDFRGVVTKRVLGKSSGDARFDSYALKAVDDSTPFPAPPPKFVDVVKTDGITLGFPQ